MKLALLLLFLIPFSASAKYRLSDKEKTGAQSSIETSCTLAKVKEQNKAKVCACISKNHILQSEFARNQKQALGGLKWVSDFYANKVSQENFDKNPYFLKDILFSIDSECTSNPKFTLTFPR